MIGAAMCCAAAAADASAEVRYAAQLRGGPGFSAVGGWVELRGLDDSKSVRIDIDGLYSETTHNPATELSTGYITGLAGGDQIEVRQPATDVDPDFVLTLAAPSVDAAPGTVFGVVPDGTSGEVITDGTCGRQRQIHTGVEGAFDFPYPDFDPGVFQTVIVTDDSTGNTTALTSAAAGETPCFQVNASAAPRSFDVAVTHLTGNTLGTSRLVLLRNGQTLLDAHGDGTGVGGKPSARPQAGDELLLYTPADELDPTYPAVTLPELSAGFYTLTGLVTFRGPAASLLRAEPAGAVNFRSATNVAAGESSFDFAVPGDGFQAFDLTNAGVAVDFASSGHGLEYVVDAKRLDPPVTPTEPSGSTDPPIQALAAPAKLTVALPGRMAVSSIKKQFGRGLKLRFTSSAEVKYSLSLTLAAQGRSTALKIASATGNTAAGKGTTRLKFTKAGLTALRSLSRERKAVLAIRATNAAGRVSASTRTTRIRP